MDASVSNLFHFAITHELWARYLLTVPGEHPNACLHLSEAIRGYNEWGAVAKSQQLLRQYQAVLTDLYMVQGKMDQEMDMETIQYELRGAMEV